MSEQRLGDAVHGHPEGATVALRVVPRAPRTALAGPYGRALKLKVAAPPVDGAANAEVRRWVADVCGVRASSIEVVAGERARDKVVLVRDLTEAELASALEAAG